MILGFLDYLRVYWRKRILHYDTEYFNSERIYLVSSPPQDINENKMGLSSDWVAIASVFCRP